MTTIKNFNRAGKWLTVGCEGSSKRRTKHLELKMNCQLLRNKAIKHQVCIYMILTFYFHIFSPLYVERMWINTDMWFWILGWWYNWRFDYVERLNQLICFFHFKRGIHIAFHSKGNSYTTLLKTLYPVTYEIAIKWRMPLKYLGKVLVERNSCIKID